MMLGWIKYTDGTIYLMGIDGVEHWAILEFNREQYDEFCKATQEFTDKVDVTDTSGIPHTFLEAFDST